jgi:hypothetical protein
VNTAPCPELNKGLFSRRVTAYVTVSRADVKELVAKGKEEGEVRKVWEAESIFRRESRYAVYF